MSSFRYNAMEGSCIFASYSIIKSLIMSDDGKSKIVMLYNHRYPTYAIILATQIA